MTPYTNRTIVKRSKSGGFGLFTLTSLRPGQVVLPFTGEIVDFASANPVSLQLSHDLFLKGETEPDDYLNHSCDPNCCVRFFRGSQILLVARRAVAAREELTFNYNTTEYDLLEQERVFKAPCAFICSCGARNCTGKVAGFRHLPLAGKAGLKQLLSPFLELKLMEELWLQEAKKGGLQAPRITQPSPAFFHAPHDATTFTAGITYDPATVSDLLSG